MKEQIELTDFLNYTFLSDVKTSLDEKHVAYVITQCDETKNQYKSYLHISDGNQYMAMTSYGAEHMFIWDDEQTLLFSNLRDDKDIEDVKKGEAKTVFYRISIHGGEAVKAFTIPLQVQAIKKIKEHEYVCLVDYDLRYSDMYMLKQEAKEKRLKEKQDMGDYEILNELPFYRNGAGYINQHRNVLFLYDELHNEITCISDKLCNIGTFELSEDHHAIYYTGEAYIKMSQYKDGIFKYDLGTQNTEQLLKAEAYRIHTICVWGEKLFVVAAEQKQYGINENGKFYFFDTKQHDLVLLADYDRTLGSSVGSDCRYGGGEVIKQYKDKLYFITTLDNRSVIYTIDKMGTIQATYEAEGSVDSFAIMQDTIYFIGMQEMKLQELYAYNIIDRKRKQITMYNEQVFQDKDIRPCVPCNFENGNIELFGWVLEPRNYDHTKSYPAILDIHGGPKTVYGEVFYHEMQVWANAGYFVFFMNPRGGDGRGNEFADIRGKYGTIDYDDIMKFTDEVLTKYPMIDSDRIGVTGGSYGGFMTNWIITHTNRFKTAVAQRSIANWVSFIHTSDIGEIFGNDQQMGDTWDHIEKLWWHSPLKYANQCVTPTLFIHSDEDYRCPYNEGLQMYSALCVHGIKTRLCMFKGENHELSRSGKPKHRVKRLEVITNWMNENLDTTIDES